MKGRMDWFRLYSEARTDAKLRSLSFAEHYVWFNLLCFASEQPARGVIEDLDLDLLAVEVANGDRELLDATLARLQKLRIVTCEADRVCFVHWQRRQYDKPSDAPEETSRRQAKHRGAVTPSLEVSHDVTPCHATEERRGDTEAEAEEDRDLVRLEDLPPTSTQEAEETRATATATAEEQELLTSMGALKDWQEDTDTSLRKIREWRKHYPDIDLGTLVCQMDTWLIGPKGRGQKASLQRIGSWLRIERKEREQHGENARGRLGANHSPARGQVRAEDDVAATDAKWAAYAELRSVR